MYLKSNTFHDEETGTASNNGVSMPEGNSSGARIYSREQIKNIEGFFVDKPGSVSTTKF